MAERLVSEAVDHTLNVWLLGTYSSQYNALSGAVTAAATELNCKFPLGEVGTGSFVAIDDELLVVTDRDTTNNRMIVVRGVRGTDAAPHAINAALDINPRFPRFMVRQMMRKELDSWPNSLYQAKTFTASLAASAGTITIPDTISGAEVLGIIRVRRGSLSTLDSRSRRTNGYDVQMGVPGAGGVIALTEDSGLITSFTVLAACGFNSDQIADFGDDCDLIGDVGLTTGMVEILELGAAYRLLMARATVRTFPEAEGQSRGAAEVPANEIPALAGQLLALRGKAEQGEVEALVSRYGFGGK